MKPAPQYGGSRLNSARLAAVSRAPMDAVEHDGPALRQTPCSAIEDQGAQNMTRARFARRPSCQPRGPRCGGRLRRQQQQPAAARPGYGTAAARRRSTSPITRNSARSSPTAMATPSTCSQGHQREVRMQRIVRRCVAARDDRAGARRPAQASLPRSWERPSAATDRPRSPTPGTRCTRTPLTRAPATRRAMASTRSGRCGTPCNRMARTLRQAARAAAAPVAGPPRAAATDIDEHPDAQPGPSGGRDWSRPHWSRRRAPGHGLRSSATG